MICPGCGKQILKETKFCGACGSKITKTHADNLSLNFMDTQKMILVFSTLIVIITVSYFVLKGNPDELAVTSPPLDKQTGESTTITSTERQEAPDEAPASESPSEELSQTPEDGIRFLTQFTELIKNRNYNEASKYYDSSMDEVLRENGTSSFEEYLANYYEKSSPENIKLEVYDQKNDMISASVTWKETETNQGAIPFIAFWKNGKWNLTFDYSY